MTKFKFLMTTAAAAASAVTMVGSAQAATTFTCDTAASSVCKFNGVTGGFSDVIRKAGVTDTDTFKLTFTQLGQFDLSLTAPNKSLSFVSFTFLGQTISPVLKGDSYSFDITKTGTYDLLVKTQNKGKNPLAYSGSFAFDAVPEPATWGMMIAGVGMAGASLRRRRSVRVAVA